MQFSKIQGSKGQIGLYCINILNTYNYILQ